MQRYILRRLLLMLPTLLGVTFVVFVMVRFVLVGRDVPGFTMLSPAN